MFPPNIRYEPKGAAYEILRNQSPEILLSGPAGTGKSISCLWKLHYLATHVKGFRGLIVRKTRVSLTESALVTYENNVLFPGHPAMQGPTRAHRTVYRYPGGGEIIVGGMDRSSRVLSTEYDCVYIQEAIELEEEEWEVLTTRLRNNRLPYQQLIADTNPDAPSHWLKKRCDAGKTLMLESRHEDNPTLWDGSGWTPRGADYIAKLDALTGARKQRLRYGRWVQAEGVVYDGWDRRVHLVPRFKLSNAWQRFWSIDFGYTNPFVCQWYAVDPDGRLYLYREWYRTGMLVEDHARHLLELCGAWDKTRRCPDWSRASEPKPVAVVCDHDAEDRATLHRHLGMETTPARKEVSPGIQAVASRLKVAGDGKPRLMVFQDALVERDPALDEKKKPCGLAEEVDGYCWDTRLGRKKGEEPLKEDDHSCDAARYSVAYADGRQRARATGFKPYTLGG